MSDELTPSSVAVVLGTRPEIIKLAELIRLLGPSARIVYTGQHYDERLGPAFFRELSLPLPDVILQVGGSPRGQQIGQAILQVSRYFAADRPTAVVVQGDTNSTLAGAIAANSLDVPLLHVEAGLRSHDRAMPEEHNRVLVDHLADLCCAPTLTNRTNLLAEGIPDVRITVTGNTVVEALQRLLPPVPQRRVILHRVGLKESGYALATFHRPENVDAPDRLASLLQQLARLPLPVLFPMHPRTAARVEAFGMTELLENVRICSPLNYVDFLALSAESAFLVSDSGGVQEEASVVKRPVLVVRNSTERPEVLGTFTQLVRTHADLSAVASSWAENLPELHEKLQATETPYGDGRASWRCVEAVRRLSAGTASAGLPSSPGLSVPDAHRLEHKTIVLPGDSVRATV